MVNVRKSLFGPVFFPNEKKKPTTFSLSRNQPNGLSLASFKMRIDLYALLNIKTGQQGLDHNIVLL